MQEVGDDFEENFQLFSYYWNKNVLKAYAHNCFHFECLFFFCKICTQYTQTSAQWKLCIISVSYLRKGRTDSCKYYEMVKVCWWNANLLFMFYSKGHRNPTVRLFELLFITPKMYICFIEISQQKQMHNQWYVLVVSVLSAMKLSNYSAYKYTTHERCIEKCNNKTSNEIFL